MQVVLVNQAGTSLVVTYVAVHLQDFAQKRKTLGLVKVETEEYEIEILGPEWAFSSTRAKFMNAQDCIMFQIKWVSLRRGETWKLIVILSWTCQSSEYYFSETFGCGRKKITSGRSTEEHIISSIASWFVDGCGCSRCLSQSSFRLTFATWIIWVLFEFSDFLCN